MVFVNAKITADDRVQYGLDVLDESRRERYSPQRDWTVDHDRHCYFRQVNESNNGPECTPNPETIIRVYNFLVENVLYEVSLTYHLWKTVSSDDGKIEHSYIVLNSIKDDHANVIDPTPLLPLLYEVLIACKGNGIYSDWKMTYTLTLMVNGKEYSLYTSNQRR